MDPISKFVTDYLLETTAQLIMPMMVIAFFVFVASRAMVFFIARSEFNFAKEFHKRVYYHFTSPDAPKVASFHRLIRILLVKTYVETFETKNKFKRRNLDHVQSLFERLFLVDEGVKRLVDDTLKQTRYLKKEGSQAMTANDQKLVEISKHVFENNPFFNRLFGVFSVGLLNDLLNILPSLFIIGGIFGTFLGISKSLPDLGSMDLSNAEETKRIMDLFLLKISQSMIKSIIGIAFSVISSVINTVLSVEGTHYGVINKYSSALENAWNETTNNEIDKTEAFPLQSPTEANAVNALNAQTSAANAKTAPITNPNKAA
jgi:hypothetical protein